eukprot:CAMPEP_0113989758 /NCGR_PEP_ID=MMETSP0328-20130328/8202_1 /TAXON_ID=39455 /ORGANISM="Alexandrium minutum" /LENGTH=36 /assembly_acc=CAM_ASM_000350
MSQTSASGSPISDAGQRGARLAGVPGAEHDGADALG